ncbi:hypothetical protein, partial [Longimicrobium sp.]|uniref:hypothetical protein n=1 Tax=Longimicrobium sp. TaxID=2029185 RepID=UPI002F94E289
MIRRFIRSTIALLLLLPAVAEGQRRPIEAVAADTILALPVKGAGDDYRFSVARPVKISPERERRRREETAVLSGVVTDS